MRLVLRMVALLAVLLGAGGLVMYEFMPWRGLAIAGSTTGKQTGLRQETIWIEQGDKRHPIQAEIADTDASRQIGLMYRDSLADDAGMLFIYPETQDVTMWMENTYVSLDMVFLDPDGTIHSIARDTEPLSRAHVDSHGPVRAVLELKAGTAARLGLAKGGRVRARGLGNAG
jgi:uncharacterized protein